MQYCLDTNVYVEAHRRYYAFDIAPGFWDGLKLLAERKAVCSPSMVYAELTSSGHEDELAKWAKANKTALFFDANEAAQDVYSEIANLVVSLYEPQHVQVFLAAADPWVIAHAKAHSLIVVTMEALKHENQLRTGKISGKIQIPNICRRVGIDYKDTFALLREQKIVLR